MASRADVGTAQPTIVFRPPAPSLKMENPAPVASPRAVNLSGRPSTVRRSDVASRRRSTSARVARPSAHAFLTAPIAACAAT